jgi:hypothetical protein
MPFSSKESGDGTTSGIAAPVLTFQDSLAMTRSISEKKGSLAGIEIRKVCLIVKKSV